MNEEPHGSSNFTNFLKLKFLEKEFVVKKRILLTGDRLINAAATVDAQSGKYVVAFEFERCSSNTL